jgi:hypothetical protein
MPMTVPIFSGSLSAAFLSAFSAAETAEKRREESAFFFFQGWEKGERETTEAR